MAQSLELAAVAAVLAARSSPPITLRPAAAQKECEQAGSEEEGRRRRERTLVQQIQQAPAIFLERYGSLLSVAQLGAFAPLAADYEVRFHLTALGVKLQEQSHPTDGSDMESDSDSGWRPFAGPAVDLSAGQARRAAAARRMARASRMQQQADTEEGSTMGDEKTRNSVPHTAVLAASPPALSVPSLPSSFSESLDSLQSSLDLLSLGTPLRPRSALAANRRLFYLQHHLAPQQQLQGEREDYFEDEEMEKRRPALFHQYIGRFKQEDAEVEEEQTAEPAEGEEQKSTAGDDESMLSSSAFPAKHNQGKNRKASAASFRKNPAQHLPDTLSSLLLRNYDRDTIKQRREAEQAQQQPTSATNDHSAASAPRASSSTVPSAIHPRSQSHAPHATDPLLCSDESELSDDSPPVPLPRVSAQLRFCADDGRVLDDDGSDLREKGPTASREMAEWIRERLDDEEDVERRAERRRRRDRAARGQQEDADVGANAGPTAQQEAEDASMQADPSESVSFPPSPPASSRSEFLQLMQSLFLLGYDAAWVDYSRIDTDADLEDWQQREREEQERYFDATEE